MIDIPTEELLKKALRSDVKEDQTLKERQKNIADRVKELMIRYQALAPSDVPKYIDEMNTIVTANDSYIGETDRQADAHLRRMMTLLEAAKEAGYPTDANPYYHVYLEASDVISQMYAANAYLNQDMDIATQVTSKLNGIVKDVNLAQAKTLQVQAETSFYTQIFNDYKAGIVERDKTIIELNQRLLEMTRLVEQREDVRAHVRELEQQLRILQHSLEQAGRLSGSEKNRSKSGEPQRTLPNFKRGEYEGDDAGDDA